MPPHWPYKVAPTPVPVVGLGAGAAVVGAAVGCEGLVEVIRVDGAADVGATGVGATEVGAADVGAAEGAGAGLLPPAADQSSGPGME